MGGELKDAAESVESGVGRRLSLSLSSRMWERKGERDEEISKLVQG